MRWITVTLLVLVVGVVSASPVSAQAPASVIRITAHEVVGQRLESGPSGMGHVESIWEELYNRRLSTRPIGHAQSLCTVLARDAANCTATFLLPGGKLVVTGARSLTGSYEVPIVGGTGLYVGARGVLSARVTDLRPRAEVLLFRLLLQR